jgi:hypothetical protein
VYDIGDIKRKENKIRNEGRVGRSWRRSKKKVVFHMLHMKHTLPWECSSEQALNGNNKRTRIYIRRIIFMGNKMSA